jgi:hypothetical protein
MPRTWRIGPLDPDHLTVPDTAVCEKSSDGQHHPAGVAAKSGARICQAEQMAFPPCTHGVKHEARQTAQDRPGQPRTFEVCGRHAQALRRRPGWTLRPLGEPGQPEQAVRQREFDVRWVIDIPADTPLEAARLAHVIQRDRLSHAEVFIVRDLADGREWRVDFSAGTSADDEGVVEDLADTGIPRFQADLDATRSAIGTLAHQLDSGETALTQEEAAGLAASAVQLERSLADLRAILREG